MNYQALTFWLSMIQWIVTLGLAVYVWASNRQKATQRELHQMDDRIDGHEGRLSIAEERIKQLPHPRDVTDLSLQLKSLDGDIRALRKEISGVREGLKPFTDSVSRINDYLLNGKK